MTACSIAAAAVLLLAALAYIRYYFKNPALRRYERAWRRYQRKRNSLMG